MISTENYNKKEVHFMVIESELVKCRPKIIEVLKILKDTILGNLVLKVDKMTIVDFDDFLKGNPHT